MFFPNSFVSNSADTFLSKTWVLASSMITENSPGNPLATKLAPKHFFLLLVYKLIKSRASRSFLILGVRLRTRGQELYSFTSYQRVQNVSQFFLFFRVQIRLRVELRHWQRGRNIVAFDECFWSAIFLEALRGYSKTQVFLAGLLSAHYKGFFIGNRVEEQLIAGIPKMFRSSISVLFSRRLGFFWPYGAGSLRLIEEYIGNSTYLEIFSHY